MRIGPFGLPEIAIVVLIVLLIFGAKRLPDIASSMGKGIRNFKSGLTNEDDNTKDD